MAASSRPPLLSTRGFKTFIEAWSSQVCYFLSLFFLCKNHMTLICAQSPLGERSDKRNYPNPWQLKVESRSWWSVPPNSVTPRRHSNIYHHVLSKGGKRGGIFFFLTRQAGLAFWLCGAFWWPTFIVFDFFFFFYLLSALSPNTAGGQNYLGSGLDINIYANWTLWVAFLYATSHVMLLLSIVNHTFVLGIK